MCGRRTVPLQHCAPSPMHSIVSTRGSCLISWLMCLQLSPPSILAMCPSRSVCRQTQHSLLLRDLSSQKPPSPILSIKALTPPQRVHLINKVSKTNLQLANHIRQSLIMMTCPQSSIHLQLSLPVRDVAFTRMRHHPPPRSHRVLTSINRCQ